jgi:pyruvate/2-oxoacid:ferredoxin oxidoreductase beta subunit
MIAEAVVELGIQDRTVLVNPVGCSVFAYYYLDVGNIQASHGRAPAVATGVRRVRPDSIVISYQGDGDLAAIGGNEILHAANRGENITVFFVNNGIYGMTGGQSSPTTPEGMFSTTTPFGNIDQPMAVSELVASAGANFVARWTTYHVRQLSRAMEELMTEEGFRFLEIISQCPTHFGKDARKEPAEVLDHYRRISVPFLGERGAKEAPEGSNISVGTIADRRRRGYVGLLEEAEERWRRRLSRAGKNEDAK